MLPVLVFFLTVNGSTSARLGSPGTFRCLYNALTLSLFTFCLSRRVDVGSLASVNDILSFLLVSGVL